MEKEKEYVAQWYWCKDRKNEWAKAYYVGPREEWMHLLKEEKENSERK
tara:strand:- start:806 stop:949 length:144 start_codon:yes stop_codon:yes gene_type:complete